MLTKECYTRVPPLPIPRSLIPQPFQPVLVPEFPSSKHEPPPSPHRAPSRQDPFPSAPTGVRYPPLKALRVSPPRRNTDSPREESDPMYLRCNPVPIHDNPASPAPVPQHGSLFPLGLAPQQPPALARLISQAFVIHSISWLMISSLPHAIIPISRA